MLDLIQITNDAAFARRCDALPGMRLFVDLERMGKAERQAGRNTFISRHEIEDVGRIRDVARHSRLMVRVNPLHDHTPAEVEAVLAHGPDLLMLPMFSGPEQVRDFAAIVAGRVPFTTLLETSGSLDTLPQWIATPGLQEVYVGLNDLHISLKLPFMFQPLAMGMLDAVSVTVHAARLRFGFGGIARLDEGLLPGRDVLAEHMRLGSRAVILSRTFHGDDGGIGFEQQVAALRQTETQLARRSAALVEADRQRIAQSISRIAAQSAARP